MIVAPAVDVRRGRCVQLVGGDPTREAVALGDPVEPAERWRALGFSTLHLVDLDAALEDGGNSDAIERVLRDVPGDAQVGGGIRDEASIERWLGLGAARVIVGTRAVNDPAWACRQADRRPGQVMVAADVREGRVLRRGWKDESEWMLDDFLRTLGSAPFAGILVTDVGREGRLAGIDVSWMVQVVETSAHPLWMSGGVSSVDDVIALERVGAAGVVIGMALYTGRIDPTDLAKGVGESKDRKEMDT